MVKPVTLHVDLRSRIGDFALDVTFESRSGITALFGPSGAGKSLTLRHIAGLVRGREGRIALGERTLFDSTASVHLPPRERRIGMVFQEYALFPHLSVRSNIEFGLDGRPKRERASRADELLVLMGLEAQADRRPRDLSGGERQRVAVARALAPEPDLLLLDEPFAALDFRVRRGLRAALRTLQLRTGIPMVLVTHALPDVREISDTLVLLDRGRVVAAGATAELLAAPPTPEAAALLESDA